MRVKLRKKTTPELTWSQELIDLVYSNFTKDFKDVKDVKDVNELFEAIPTKRLVYHVREQLKTHHLHKTLDKVF